MNKKLLIILLLAICLITSMWLGVALGAIPYRTGESTKTSYATEYIDLDGETYKCDIYDNGSITIYTKLQYVTNEGDNLIVKGAPVEDLQKAEQYLKWAIEAEIKCNE